MLAKQDPRWGEYKKMTYVLLVNTKRGLRTVQDDDGYTKEFEFFDEACEWARENMPEEWTWVSEVGNE